MLKVRNKFDDCVEDLERVGIAWIYPRSTVMVVKSGPTDAGSEARFRLTIF